MHAMIISALVNNGRRLAPLLKGAEDFLFAPFPRKGVVKMTITLSELFQFCLVIIAIINLVIQAKKK